jgi:hypothetical protein
MRIESPVKEHQAVDPNQPFAVISHDSGGAEILSSLLLRQRTSELLVLEGPAVAIFERKLGAVRPLPLEEAVQRSAWVLSGTSWQSDLEWRALVRARELGKPSVAFLDHWINYKERFLRGGRLCMPDEIWVGDDYAARMARSQFAGQRVRLVENPYFDDVRRSFASLQGAAVARRGPSVLLYVTEPMREHGLLHYGDERYFGYTEEEAVQYFLQNVKFIASDVARIVIRAHPSEPQRKYTWAREQVSAPLDISEGKALIEDIAAADVVVGCESMAMVVAVLGGKRVVSAIPPGGHPCALPQAEIELLQDLIRRGTH